MAIDDRYNPFNLVMALRHAQPKHVKGNDGFKAALVVETDTLSSLDKDNLKEAFVGDFYGDAFYHWICDHFQKPIEFDTAVIATESAEDQKRNLETRLLYDIYRRTGVKLQAPHKNAVQIF